MQNVDEAVNIMTGRYPEAELCLSYVDHVAQDEYHRLRGLEPLPRGRMDDLMFPFSEA